MRVSKASIPILVASLMMLSGGILLLWWNSRRNKSKLPLMPSINVSPVYLTSSQPIIVPQSAPRAAQMQLPCDGQTEYIIPQSQHGMDIVMSVLTLEPNNRVMLTTTEINPNDWQVKVNFMEPFAGIIIINGIKN